MTGFDEDLRGMLEREANRIAPEPGRRRAAVGRVRRRRGIRAAGTGAVATAVAVGMFAGGSSLLSGYAEPDGLRPASQPSPAFDWTRGTYPVLAEGTYAGRDWVLRVVEDPDAAHPEDTESERPEVLFEIEGPGPNGGAFETHTAWEGVDASFQDKTGGGGEYVMGMVASAASTVTVELDGGESIGAAVVGDDERYFLAFLPDEAEGSVVARDSTGAVVGTAPLPGAFDLGDVRLDCSRDLDDERTYVGSEGLPVLGRGTFQGRRWIVSLVEDPDALHPEDPESDAPELAFEIEGPWPNAGSMETYDEWDGVSPPFHDALDGGFAYAFGMASPDAASVTIEPDDGEPLAAELFDARGVPREGAQLYVAFFSEEITGEIVARDAAGDVLGRVRLPRLSDPPAVCDRQ
ncbi:MAG TPA: hypothetical protein VHI71_05830 [Actinomycetota bacterium]|nr:hypothetical protein [Actinomycetota bacterium]